MNKRKVGRTFSRKTDIRHAFLRELLRSFAQNGRIHTTDARAREIRALAERLVTHAKKGTLASHRYLISYLGTDTAKKFEADVTKKFSKRVGGYTRIIKKAARKSDGAKLAIIEYV